MSLLSICLQHMKEDTVYYDVWGRKKQRIWLYIETVAP